MSVFDLPLVLMILAAPLGAIDVLYFHMWKFRLYEAPSARTETLIHAIRGLNFSAAAFALANFQLSGAWFWIVGTLFLIEVGINVVDVLIEPASRAPLGGLPRLEYLLHILGSTFAGAIAVSYFVLAWTSPSPFDRESPGWLIVQGNAIAGGGLLLTLTELALFCGSRATATSRVDSVHPDL